MNEFLAVLAIASVAAVLTYLGAPLAERVEVPDQVVNAALQFSAGIITALVAFSLMPPAVRIGPSIWVAVAFFAGGAAYVLVDYFTVPAPGEQDIDDETAVVALGLYVGILVDLVIDGAVIGIGASLTVMTGLLLALGMALSTLPLAFVTVATARRQGMLLPQRRILSGLIFLCVLAGAVLGYLVVRNQPESVKYVLVALASGFLVTTVTQSLIPTALGQNKGSLSGLFYVAGLTIYGVITLAFG